MSKIPMFPNKFAIFASVLGVGNFPLHIVEAVNLNSYVDSNETFFVLACTNGPGNSANLTRGILICRSTYSSGRYAAQLYIETIDRTNKIYLRTYDESWSSWKEL